MTDATAFERQMVVMPGSGPGRYDVVLDPLWNCPTSMHGGTAAAVVASAMASELATPEQALRTISCVYAAPVGPGPVEIDVSVLRRGRTVSQLTATMRNEGATAGLTAIAAFGGERPSYEYTDVTMPEVRPPGEPRPITERDPRAWNPYWQPGSADNRYVLGSTGPDDWEPTSLIAQWLRFDEPPMRADGSLDPLAVVAFGDVMPSAVRERMGRDPRQPQSSSVSADYSVHLLAPARSEWLLMANRCHAVGDGYASVEGQLWDEHGTLVAFASAVLILLFPDGPPPDDLRRPPR